MKNVSFLLTGSVHKGGQMLKTEAILKNQYVALQVLSNHLHSATEAVCAEKKLSIIGNNIGSLKVLKALTKQLLWGKSLPRGTTISIESSWYEPMKIVHRVRYCGIAFDPIEQELI